VPHWSHTGPCLDCTFPIPCVRKAYVHTQGRAYGDAGFARHHHRPFRCVPRAPGPRHLVQRSPGMQHTGVAGTQGADNTGVADNTQVIPPEAHLKREQLLKDGNHDNDVVVVWVRCPARQPAPTPRLFSYHFHIWCARTQMRDCIRQAAELIPFSVGWPPQQ